MRCSGSSDVASGRDWPPGRPERSADSDGRLRRGRFAAAGCCRRVERLRASPLVSQSRPAGLMGGDDRPVPRVDHLRPGRAFTRRRGWWPVHDHAVHHTHTIVDNLPDDHHDYHHATRDARTDTRRGSATVGSLLPAPPSRPDITTICRTSRRRSRCRTPWLRCRTAFKTRPITPRRPSRQNPALGSAPVTGYGPPDDPSEAPTGFIDYSDDGQLPPDPGRLVPQADRSARVGLVRRDSARVGNLRRSRPVQRARRFDTHLHVADDVNRGHDVHDHPGNHDDRSSGCAGTHDHPDLPADDR